MLSVSCPSSRLCLAVDAAGRALYTTHPTWGGHHWSRPAYIDRRGSLTAVSCPTTKLCVAVDDAGNVLSTTRPTRGAKAWSRPVRIDSSRSLDGGPAGLLGISCPTVSLCVAVDGGSPGNVLSTTRPQGGTWRTVGLGGPLASVSCAAPSLCMVGGLEHVVSTAPTGGRSAWHFTGGPAGGGSISALDCPLTTLCVGVGFGNVSPGLAMATASPRSSRSWRTADLMGSPPQAGAQLLDAVGCAGRTLCVALDTADDAFVSTNPTGRAWGGGRPIRAKSASQQNAISCTAKLCAVVDSSGMETTGVVHP